MNPLPAPRLSLCMIVRNEAATLARCLESVRPLAPEIVVVDTGSTDASIRLAREFGAQVIETAWPGDFSVARNRSLAAATAPWILVLDADEWLEPAAAAGIAERARREPAEAFELIQNNADASGHRIRNAIVRLFPRRPEVRYVHPIHEEVNLTLVRAGIPIRPTDLLIEHSGYVDAGRMAEKLRRNRAILEAALARGAEGAEAQHLHFYLGGSWFEDRRWLDAAREFEWCREHSAPDSRLARVAQLRAAECHVRGGDPAKARSLLPTTPSASVHPAALLLVADLLAPSRPDEAGVWYEALLGVADVAHEPPVALGAFKTRALQWLAEDWGTRRDRKDIGVKLLRLAIEIHRRLRDGASPELQALYAAIVRG